MSRTAVVVLLAALALVSVGCASTQTGTHLNGMTITEHNSTPVAHVNGNSWGIYLLPIVPICTGDTANGSGLIFGSDTCRVDPVVDMVTRKAKAMGAEKVTDLRSSVTSFPILPPIIWYKSIEVSGNAVK